MIIFLNVIVENGTVMSLDCSARILLSCRERGGQWTQLFRSHTRSIAGRNCLLSPIWSTWNTELY